MVFTPGAYAIFGALILIFTIIFGYYWNVLRKIKGFPLYHVLPHVIRYQMSRKRDVSFNNFLFQILEDVYKKHAKEGLCMTYMVHPILYIFGEEPTKVFLNEKAAVDKPIEYKIISDGIGSGLLASSGERWKTHRKLLNPVFKLGMLKEKVRLFNEHALALVEELKTVEGKPSTDYLNLIKRHYFNALNESILGLNQNKENKIEIENYFRILDKLANFAMSRMYMPWMWFMFLFYLFPSGRRWLKMYHDLNNFSRNAINETKKIILSSNNSDDTENSSKNLDKSLSSFLVQHHLKDPSFTLDDVNAQVNNFIVAGYDTVSYTTMWCLFLLGLHPEIQERAYQEVQSACHNCVTYDELSNFTYLNAVIMETLRIYPTVPIYARHLNQDVQVGKFKVHKGTTLLFCAYFYHRNPVYYPDPEKFDPERFLNTEERKPWLHIPFAEGVRSCIGKKYAMIEMKIFLAHILRNFKIVSLDKREDLQLCCAIVLTPLVPLRMLFTPRLNTTSS